MTLSPFTSMSEAETATVRFMFTSLEKIHYAISSHHHHQAAWTQCPLVSSATPFRPVCRLHADCVCTGRLLLHHSSTFLVHFFLAFVLFDHSTIPNTTCSSNPSSGILHYMTEEIQLLLHNLVNYMYVSCFSDAHRHHHHLQSSFNEKFSKRNLYNV